MCRAQPNYVVLYPCDAFSTERLTALAAAHVGPVYIRTSRPKTPVIYRNDEPFAIGGLKVLRQSTSDVASVVGAGVTVFEALKAYDALKAAGTAIRVIDIYSLFANRSGRLVEAGSATRNRIITSKIITWRAALAMR
jgi:transketolase